MYDVVIKNASVLDGTGAPAFSADIGIKEERIALIGKICGEEGRQVINASGMTVTPGFIDPHTHADIDLLWMPSMEAWLKQGVTTVVSGNCGHGLAPVGKDVFYGPVSNFIYQEYAGADPFALVPLFVNKGKAKRALKDALHIDLDWDSFGSFYKKVSQLPLGCNVAPLAGYNVIRTAVMGEDCKRTATEKEILLMEQMTEKCMEEGAFGLSTGRDPMYIPGPYASDEEMSRMLLHVKEHDGIFTSHTKNGDKEGNPDRFYGYEEMFRQARAAGVRTHVSHVHVSGIAENREEATVAARKTLECFKAARAEGVDLSFDVIPSTSCSDFTIPYFAYYIKPLVLISGSRRRLAKNFQINEFRDMFRAVVSDGKIPYLDPDSGIWWFYEITVFRHKNKSYVGKKIAECKEMLQMDLLDTVMTIFSEDPDMGADIMAEDMDNSLDILFTDEKAMPCSDGSCYARGQNMSGNDELPVYINQMNSSYIPRFLTRFGGKDASQAVHRATGLVAERFHIRDRGIIKEGNYADIVVLDLGSLRDYDGEKDPEGIRHVFVNGKHTVENGRLMKNFGGQVLQK